MELKEKFDRSFWFLLLSNILVIIIAVIQKWNLIILMWIYLFQSIIIGFFNFVRILTLKDFSTEGLKINDVPVKPSKAIKILTAIFFAFHYGLFHIIYIIFLFAFSIFQSFGSLNKSDIVYILILTIIFFGNHLFSFFYNKNKDLKKQNLGRLLFFPYARIIPMHLTLIIGFQFVQSSLLLFLILKTLADIIMHIIEHS